MKTILNFLFKTLLVLIGFLICIFYLWFRFLRERLPREIPFTLNIFSFISLFYICLIFFILILVYKKLLTEKKENIINTNYFYTLLIYYIDLCKYYIACGMLFLRDNIMKPFYILDDSIKHSKIGVYIEKIFIFIIPWIEKFFYPPLTPFVYLPYTKFYYIFQLLPRIIIVSVLFIDIFYFSKLEYIYKCIPLYISIIMCRYMIYSFEKLKLKLTDSLEKTANIIYVSDNFMQEDFLEEDQFDNIEVNEETSTGLNKFIMIQSFVLIFGSKFKEEKFHFDILHLWKYDDILEYSIQVVDPSIKNEFLKKLKLVLFLEVFIHEYENASKDNNRIKKIKLGIYSIYFICWLYVLIYNIIWTGILTYILL